MCENVKICKHYKVQIVHGGLIIKREPCKTFAFCSSLHFIFTLNVPKYDIMFIIFLEGKS